MEKFIEDFWLLGETKEKLAICEVKSVVKAFKKGAIYDAYNHREQHELPENFPSILFVNYNLQAASWADKDTPIQQADYKIAVANRVLVVRIEDLVQIWYALQNNKITKQEVLAALAQESGWLRCDGNGIAVHK